MEKEKIIIDDAIALMQRQIKRLKFAKDEMAIKIINAIYSSDDWIMVEEICRDVKPELYKNRDSLEGKKSKSAIEKLGKLNAEILYFENKCRTYLRSMSDLGLIDVIKGETDKRTRYYFLKTDVLLRLEGIGVETVEALKKIKI